MKLSPEKGEGSRGIEFLGSTQGLLRSSAEYSWTTAYEETTQSWEKSSERNKGNSASDTHKTGNNAYSR